MPVHIYGQPAEMHSILEIAQSHNLTVVEDCSQAHGAEIDGQIVGTFADISAYSCLSNQKPRGNRRWRSDSLPIQRVCRKD